MPTIAENSNEEGNEKSDGFSCIVPKKLEGDPKVSSKLTSSPLGACMYSCLGSPVGRSIEVAALITETKTVVVNDFIIN